MKTRLILLCAAAAVGLLASGQVLSQHTVHRPYDIETFGAFRQLMLTGDFSPKVRLAEVMAKHPATGVRPREGHGACAAVAARRPACCMSGMTL